MGTPFFLRPAAVTGQVQYCLTRQTRQTRQAGERAMKFAGVCRDFVKQTAADGFGTFFWNPSDPSGGCFTDLTPRPPSLTPGAYPDKIIRDLRPAPSAGRGRH